MSSTGSQSTHAGLIGRSLGDFVIREKLGEGGFGAVYRAEQVHLAREAVIKVLRDRHQADGRIIERFKREAHLASALEHPYTAHIYAFGAETDGLLWIAMELVRGTPMDRILEVQGAIPIERFVPLLDKICQVVHTAHEHGIVHRDLKPANVMVLSRAGRLLPKLLDFGIAKGLGGPQAGPRPGRPGRVTEGPKPDNTAPQGGDGFSDNGRSGTTGMPVSGAAMALAETGVVAPFPADREVALAKTMAGAAGAVGLGAIEAQAATAEQLPQQASQSQGQGHGEDVDAGRLTVGAMGSPLYMAPEQWSEAAVDARTDIYALGVLAYETLTGRPPFRGTIGDVRAAHQRESVPPLGPSFPVALDAVLSRAMAKRPEERYQTALAFGTAFRDAAGASEEAVNLPVLDEALSAMLMARAPRPIAQVVSALRAARNLHQARDRMVDVARVAMRYVGLLCLACCSHTGGKKTNDVVPLLVRKLRQEGLGAAEWGRLGRELCRPFAHQRYAYPVPELVSLYFPEEATGVEESVDLAGPTGAAGSYLTMAALDELRELKTALFNPAQSEEQLRELMGRYLGHLATILAKLSFLADYPLAVPRRGDLEIWMGAAGALRPTPLRHRLETERPLLIDQDGAPVLSLWPLIQTGEPTPGAPLELFLFEGKGRHGAKLVAMPAGFERQDEAPWQWFRQHFFGLGDEAEKPKEAEEAPYLGLMSFSPAQAGLFFGREREAESALNRLRVQPLLAVVGPSGAGKSSFVQAGIVPGLPEGTQVITVRPGTAPASTLIARLGERGVATAALGAALEERRAKSNTAHFEALGVALRSLAEGIPVPGYVVLIVDQFEELFTLSTDPSERRLYGEWLARAARSADDRVRIILTLRDDFLVRAKELSGLSDRLTQGLELLTTPAHEDLVRILVEPARHFGYEFDDPELPEEMAQSVEGQPGALPLLAFTAAKLWELRDRQFRQLLRSAYQGMGGVGGALARHAEEMLGQMPREEQRIVREAFRRLVTSEGTRAVLTGPELEQVLGGTSEATQVLEKLVAARLLIASEGDGGLERIEVVHEALLSAWPRLVRWRSEDAEGARLRDQLAAAARQWNERGRPSGLLWRDDAWIEFQLWRARYQGKLTEIEEAFATASQAQANRTRRRKRALISLAVSALALFTVLVTWQRNKTRLELLSLYEEQGRQELLAGHADRAIVYLSESYSGGNDSASLRYLLGQAMQQFDHVQVAPLVGHRDWVHSAAFSPDGKTLLTASADKTAKRWDASSGKLLGTLEGHGGALTRAAFSADGTKIVTASFDRTARIWDAATGHLLTMLTGHRASVSDAAFTADGRDVVTASFDGTARIWDAATGQLKHTLEGHRGSVNAVASSPDGEFIATAGNDGHIRLWSRGSAQLIRSLTGHLDAINSVSFSPDSSLIVTASADGTAKLWDRRSGMTQTSLEGHAAIVYSAVFSPNGTRIVTASVDRKAKLWDAKSGKLLADLGDDSSFIHSAAFSPDTRQVVTAGYDHTARLWNVALETRSAEEIKEIVATRVPFQLEGERLIANPRVAPEHPMMAPSSSLSMRMPLAPAVDPMLKTYEFETLRLGERGEKLGQRKLEARYFSEDLGSGVQLEMVLIPPGTFLMGSPVTERDRNETSEAQHPVTVRSFYMSKYEVTQAVWRTVMGNNPSKYQGSDNNPVEAVSWSDAMEFSERLSQRTGRLYRLPSEAEWEYACRAGTTTPFAVGDTIITEYINFDGNYAYGAAQHSPLRNRTIPAGSLGIANAFGLFEMHGNVWEWCMDWYHDTYQGAPADGSAWELPPGQSRVLRGGSWDNGGLNSRCANRNAGAPVSKFVGRIGFRVAAVP